MLMELSLQRSSLSRALTIKQYQFLMITFWSCRMTASTVLNNDIPAPLASHGDYGAASKANPLR